MTKPAKEVKRLKGKRDRLKEELNEFADFVANYNPSLESQIMTQIEMIERTYEEFCETQDELRATDTEVEACKLEHRAFREIYLPALTAARNLITSPRSKSTPASEVLNQTIVEPRIKLPTLNLPEFNGNLEQFCEFRDSFMALVHENNNVPKIQKFYYLRGALKGDAVKVIQALEPSELNYDVAWDLLKERYENKKLLIHSHLSSILELPVLAKEDCGKLRAITDTLTRNLRCLRTLKVPVDTWDLILVHIISNKLDYETKRAWETEDTASDLPTMKEFSSFLQKRCNVLEAMNKKAVDESKQKRVNKVHSFVVTEENECPLCKAKHQLYQCDAFNKLTTAERWSKVKTARLCFNCLKKGHRMQQCKSRGCYKCNKRHHSSLHSNGANEENRNGDIREAPRRVHGATGRSAAGDDGAQNVRIASGNGANNGQVAMANSGANNNERVASSNCCYFSNGKQTLLSTAMVFLEDEQGNTLKCRALLDNGAQCNFIRRNVCDEMNLKQTPITSTVCGIGRSEASVISKVEVKLNATFGHFEKKIKCLVLDNITDRIPAESFCKRDMMIPNYVRLADPLFNVSNDVDILLGADVFWSVLEERKLEFGTASLRQTKLGWIWAGSAIPGHVTNSRMTVNLALQDILCRFWELEQVIPCNPMSDEQRECERHFQENTTRNSTGRFVVRIPLKGEPNLLGESEQQARKRQMGLERRFRADSIFKGEYSAFMAKYLEMGHMRKVNATEDRVLRYFMPHHGVVKDSSTTTRLRTVFDSSARTTTGYSFNDLQLVGPVVQEDLFTILINFRLPRYAITADVEKMYRQVLVHPEQRNLQTILWRQDEEDEMQTYELNTITYGTASAPYLATRCLKQIALDLKNSDPKLSHVIEHCMYVDDFLGGANTIEEANKTALKLKRVLLDYGFPLKKWLSNEPKVLDEIPTEDCASVFVPIGEMDTSKTLGLIWSHNSDELMFHIQPPNNLRVSTKRELLSCIAKIYDPLGLIAPSVILAKLMLQNLWQEHIKWDEPLPDALLAKWKEFAEYLPALNDLPIPRRVLVDNVSCIELHGFSDASELALGACIYLRAERESGQAEGRLLCARSKVAPLRSETIPRLELCAAALLAKLVSKVISSMTTEVRRCVLWSDSTIALAWIKTEPYLLKQFVANRVSQIQTLNVTTDWRHVSSGDNPADLVSRGVRADYLQGADLWWHGPSWLRKEEVFWPEQSTSSKPTEIPEVRLARLTANVATEPEPNAFFRIGGWNKMIRAAMIALRWLKISREKTGTFKEFGPSDFNDVLKRLIRVEQRKYFDEEMKQLRNGNMVRKGSCLFKLRPFLDDEGIVRIGGRLEHAELTYDARHQIILPSESELTIRIVEFKHTELLHCGAQQLLFNVRQTYWPIRGRVLAKQIVRKCVVCCKANPKVNIPVFGALPVERVVPQPPFYNTGADYGGPYLIRDRRTRGYKVTKGYICVFVCLSTKAIHLELVSDLTSEAFIACLRRFIARRGKPKTINTDNATNFVGSNNNLIELNKFLKQNNTKIQDTLLGEGIEWKFIPPRSPSFGGIWEAGVKSVKKHLKRVAGESLLMFEEFYTLLTQIEAILNSRPLSSLSNDPDDLLPLTPGHFLIGRPITSLVDENLSDVKLNRLGRYQLLQQLVQNFWTRWSQEYLHELQCVRGDREQSTVKIGSLVLLGECGLPPCKWRLGRVCELFPGADGIVRVVRVKTSAGECKRAVRNICVLPIDN